MNAQITVGPRCSRDSSCLSELHPVALRKRSRWVLVDNGARRRHADADVPGRRRSRRNPEAVLGAVYRNAAQHDMWNNKVCPRLS